MKFNILLTATKNEFFYLENKNVMKSNAMFWVAMTTFVLIILTIMAAMKFPFNWVFYVTVIGQTMVAYMVYKVLTDNYSTDKTFEDFYEDNPIGKRLT